MRRKDKRRGRREARGEGEKTEEEIESDARLSRGHPALRSRGRGGGHLRAWEGFDDSARCRLSSPFSPETFCV